MNKAESTLLGVSLSVTSFHFSSFGRFKLGSDVSCGELLVCSLSMDIRMW